MNTTISFIHIDLTWYKLFGSHYASILGFLLITNIKGYTLYYKTWLRSYKNRIIVINGSDSQKALS